MIKRASCPRRGRCFAEKAAVERVGEAEPRRGGISCPLSTREIGYQRGERPPVLGRGSAASGDYGGSDLHLILYGA
jgi:hypothetical protein